MFILCLLFDIRDINIDRAENIKTLPVILGKQRSYAVAQFGLLLFFILSVIHFILYGEKGVLIALSISTLATFFAIKLTKRSGTDLVYLAGIDGMMLLQSSLVYLFGLNL
jgi:4-hydroxybenzoate polyprenyltransferase